MGPSGDVPMIPEARPVEVARAEEPVSPDRLLQLCNGFQASALLAAGATHQLFTHIENGARTAEQIAERAGIALRGAQAVLDGLAGLGVIKRESGRYTNAEDTSRFLVEGKPSSITDLARLSLHTMPDFTQLADVARTGRQLGATHESPDNPFWPELVPSLASLAYPVAKEIATTVGVAGAKRPSILDIGGGSGIYTLVCLGENEEAIGTQIDWPSVNQVARRFAARFGVADRFRTVDGDYHTTCFGQEAHDVAIYAHVAHLESPRKNAAIFKRVRRALKPGGTLVISDFILDEDRQGKPFAGIFHANMLLHTSGGAVWRRPDYSAWLAEAGFGDVSFVETASPATLVFAR
jgi:SAM-dependent methyltransferase